MPVLRVTSCLTGSWCIHLGLSRLPDYKVLDLRGLRFRVTRSEPVLKSVARCIDCAPTYPDLSEGLMPVHGDRSRVLFGCSWTCVLGQCLYTSRMPIARAVEDYSLELPEETYPTRRDDSNDPCNGDFTRDLWICQPGTVEHVGSSRRVHWHLLKY